MLEVGVATKFYCGIDADRSNKDRFDGASGLPLHPILNVVDVDDTHIRIRMLLHQSAFGPQGVVPSLESPLRYAEYTMRKSVYERMPVCSYRMQDGCIVGIKTMR